jgi:hypothetical protein
MSNKYLALVLLAILCSFVAAKVIPIRKASSKAAKSLSSSSEVAAIDTVTLSSYDPYVVSVNTGSTYTTSVDMAIALYTSTTFFSGTYSYFDYFSCISTYGCSTYSSTSQSYAYPFFTLSTGYTIQLPYYLDASDGDEDYGTYSGKAFYATSATGGFSEDVSGSIGFGVSGSGYSNFLSGYDQFAIYLSDDGENGQLAFGENEDYMGSDVNSITVNANWTASIYEIGVGDDYFTEYADLSVIFDLSYSYIAVPSTTLTNIISYLEDYELYCTLEEYDQQAYCTYDGGDSDNIPSIYLGSIELPMEVYLESDGDDSYYLNIVGTSTTSSSYYDYELVTSSYSSYAIIGTPFMKYFYTVFDYSDSYAPTIYFYNVPSGPSGGSIAGIVIGSVVFLFACCYCCKKPIRKTGTKVNYALPPAPQVTTTAYYVQPQEQVVFNQFGQQNYVPPVQQGYQQPYNGYDANAQGFGGQPQGGSYGQNQGYVQPQGGNYVQPQGYVQPQPQGGSYGQQGYVQPQPQGGNYGYGQPQGGNFDQGTAQPYSYQ